MRVLVIDDSHDLANLMCKLIRIAGHECRWAGSGAEAVQMVTTWPPHLVFCDINMPEMDGFETACQLRARTAAKLVALTAMEEEVIQEARIFDGYASKPIAYSTLQAILDEST